MAHMCVLFEHAAGYALFRVKEFEEISMLLPQVEASVTDFARFNSVVSLLSFAPFKTAIVALENANSVSEGMLPNELQVFLETQLPRVGKKSKYILGVGDPKLGACINETLGLNCSHTGAVPEIIRGVRYHFDKLVKGFTSKSASVAQLGLGHSYSRAKVKFNVNRADNMIIQSIALLDQLDKDINTFSMRIREWYSYHFPELIKVVPENYMYAKVAQYIKNRKELDESKLEALEEIVMDSGKAQAILDASRSSMGMDISVIDLVNIETFAARVVSLADYRQKLSTYLQNKMGGVAPNLASLIGEQVGARLIAHAGSLTNLAKYPASTVQILGAEKALFRALKTRSNTPKYGLIYHSTFISRAGLRNKGRISRYLANKCSIASRIDCFADIPTKVFGEKLRQQVEDRLKFYETGQVPAKNIEVMKEAIEEAAVAIEEIKGDEKKKKKKKKRKKSLEATEENVEISTNDTSVTGNNSVEQDENVIRKSKKKKRKSGNDSEIAEPDVNMLDNSGLNGETPKKKKKKRSLVNE